MVLISAGAGVFDYEIPALLYDSYTDVIAAVDVPSPDEMSGDTQAVYSGGYGSTSSVNNREASSDTSYLIQASGRATPVMNGHHGTGDGSYEELLKDSVPCPTCRGLGRVPRGREPCLCLCETGGGGEGDVLSVFSKLEVSLTVCICVCMSLIVSWGRGNDVLSGWETVCGCQCWCLCVLILLCCWGGVYFVCVTNSGWMSVVACHHIKVMCAILFILQHISVANIFLSDNVYDITIACLLL